MVKTKTAKPGVKQGKGPQKTYENLWLNVQEGLLKYFIHSSIIIVHITPSDSSSSSDNDLLPSLRAAIDELKKIESEIDPKHSIFAFGVRPDLWLKIDPTCIPVINQLDQFKKNAFLAHGEKYTGGDFVFWIKSTTSSTRDAFAKRIVASVSKLGTIQMTNGFHRVNRTIIGGFVDGITNPIEPALASNYIISDAPDDKRGGCFGLLQKFEYNYDQLTKKFQTDLELAVGRSQHSGNLNLGNKQSHIVIARTDGAHGTQGQIIRLPYLYNNNPANEREEGMYFVGLAGKIKTFNNILNAQMKKKESQKSDSFLNMMTGLEGSFWWFPTRTDLSLVRGEKWDDISHMLVPFWQVRSKNGYMFYNMHDYLLAMGTKQYADNPPSARILRLVGKAFTRWGNTWYHKPETPQVPHLNTFLKKTDEELAAIPVATRKGLAIKYSLGEVFTRKEWEETPPNDYASVAGIFRISPDEIIAGVLPSTSFGLGKEVMPYFTTQETLQATRFGLSEASNMGHIVPDYQFVLDNGIDAVIAHLKSQKTDDLAEQLFFGSSILAMEGVQQYLINWSNLAKNLRQKFFPDYAVKGKKHLEQMEKTLVHVAHKKPTTLTQAAQLVFSLHCCLHLTGEPVSVGRLDVLLAPYVKGTITDIDYTEQEIIDAFFLKFGERVLMNRLNVEDHSTNVGLTVAFRAGAFPGGSAINQWGQQITVGGYKAQETAEEVGNAVTMMALRSIRRLPLNAPCLSLRVTPQIHPEIVKESAKAVLSGGAHPVFMHDDRLCPALADSAIRGSISVAESRDYSCDGCYEPMITGASEFTFLTINTTQCIEYALNEGATYQLASSMWLRGSCTSFRSTHSKNINTFDHFKEVYAEHLKFQSFMTLANMLDGYGNLANIAPSPLLSALLKGCIENKRDYTNGGAKHRILSIMFVGISNTANSLYAIKQLVFNPETKVASLPDLLNCLICDWGHDMKEPFASDAFEGPIVIARRAEMYQKWREIALNLPKFGSGNYDVDSLAHWVVDQLFIACEFALANPVVKASLDRIDKMYKTKNWMMCPGAGSFEGYVPMGAGLGASADGRRSGAPIASDFSAAPLPQDLPIIKPLTHKMKYTIKSWDYEAINKISNGAEIDFNISEEFNINDLIAIVNDFKNNKFPGTVLTFTCCDPATYANANLYPTKYELLRVRTGGWSEFFIALYDAHKWQNERRQYLEV